jgi:hypothetical protein
MSEAAETGVSIGDAIRLMEEGLATIAFRAEFEPKLAELRARLALFDQMREALKALELQALQSSVNRPSHELGMEALGMTRSVLARIEALEKGEGK